MTLRYQIITLRVPFDPAHNKTVPSEWSWSELVEFDGEHLAPFASTDIVLVDADPVSDDPDVQPTEKLPDEALVTTPDRDPVDLGPAITVKRQFGVWLEDAFTVHPEAFDEPPDAESVAEWAHDHMDAIYAAANDPDDPAAVKMWEDEHKQDLDFPESEVTVEVP